MTSRVQVAGLDPWRLGGEMWGWYADGRLRSLCYAGANLVPICATPEAVRAFADRARRAGRRCSSIVGPAEPTAAAVAAARTAAGAPPARSAPTSR